MSIIIELVNDYKNGSISGRQLIGLVKNNKDIKNEIIELTTFLNQYDNIDIVERLYYIVNDIHDIIKCKYCNNKAIWSGRLMDGYKEICSNKECRSKQLANIHQGQTKISKNRDIEFIELQKSIKGTINDQIIKDLVKYDKFVELIDNPLILNYLHIRYKDSSSILETIQRIKLGVDEKPKCPTCGMPVSWIGKRNKLFSTYCSNKCAARNKNTTDKKKATSLERWGTLSCYDSSIYKQYLKESIGVEYHTQREDIKEKRRNTLIEHFGTTRLFQVKEIRDKIISTNRKKYGADYPMQNEIFKKHKMESDNFSLCTSKEENELYELLVKYFPSIQRFHKHPVLYPYNCDFFIPEKMLFIEYQGSQYHHGHPYNSTDNNDIIELETLKNKVKLNDEKSKFAEGIIHTWTVIDPEKRNYAKNHNTNLYEIWPGYKIDNIVEDIMKYENTTEYENIEKLEVLYINEIINWLSKNKIAYQLDNNIININKSNINIKFLLLSKNNEIYIQGKDIIAEKIKYSNINKNLIYIWEDEWNDKNKQEIIKSRILSKIYHNKIIKIYARKCKVGIIENAEYKKFLDENHLHGYVHSEFKYGLFYNNELVEVIGIGLSRSMIGKQKKEESKYELIRLCTKKYYNVIGGFSKLLKYIINKENIQNLFSYVDLCWSDINCVSYNEVGFSICTITKPGYWWVVNNKKDSRLKYTKKRLETMGFTNGKTENEIMHNLGFYRIFNPGNLKLQYLK